MKKLTKFLLCVLLILSSAFGFVSCGENDDVLSGAENIKQYFETKTPTGTPNDALEKMLSWDYSQACSDTIFAKSKVKIISVLCMVEFDPTKYSSITLNDLPDSFTTTCFIDGDNFEIRKTEYCSPDHAVTMTPASNPYLPEVLNVGDEFSFKVFYGEKSHDYCYLSVYGLRMEFIPLDE